MAGTFLRRIPIFNRAPITLYVMFDGERSPIPPGLSDLPDKTVWKAQNQNPIMGTGDPYNPGAMGTKYLIVTEEDEHWHEPLTKDEWEAHTKRPCREDETIWFTEKYGDDQKAKLIQRGSRHSVAAKNRMEAGTFTKGIADFTAKEA